MALVWDDFKPGMRVFSVKTWEGEQGTVLEQHCAYEHFSDGTRIDYKNIYVEFDQPLRAGDRNANRWYVHHTSIMPVLNLTASSYEI